MNNKFDLYPFNLSVRLKTKSSSLHYRLKQELLNKSKFWRENTKISKGSEISWKGFSYGEYTQKLKYSLIKLQGELYQIIEELEHGGMGRIAILRKVADDSLILAKIFLAPCEISKAEANLNELGLLEDAGLSRGYGKRVWRQKNQFTGEKYGPYFLKHYVLMPFLGRNLKAQIIEQEGLEKQNESIGSSGALQDNIRLEKARIWEAINFLASLHFFHRGNYFISGKGATHHDLKLGNIILSKSGIYIIDYGLSEQGHNGADELVYLIGGTPGYYMLIPSFLDIEDEDNRVKGRLIDMEAARRILWSELCEDPPRVNEFGEEDKYNKHGILTSEMIRKYNLKELFELSLIHI